MINTRAPDGANKNVLVVRTWTTTNTKHSRRWKTGNIRCSWRLTTKRGRSALTGLDPKQSVIWFWQRKKVGESTPSAKHPMGVSGLQNSYPGAILNGRVVFFSWVRGTRLNSGDLSSFLKSPARESLRTFFSTVGLARAYHAGSLSWASSWTSVRTLSCSRRPSSSSGKAFLSGRWRWLLSALRAGGWRTWRGL